MSPTVTISVPATSANIGPGYDCLGLALSLYNRATITRLEGSASIVPHHPMVQAISDLFFRQTEVKVAPFGFSWSMTGDVPLSRGLGSSVTVRLGVLMGLNELCNRPLSKQQLFVVCSEAEGHPDNVGPAVFGGFVLSNQMQWTRFEVQSRLRTVLLIPDFEVATDHARAGLPKTVPHAEAARNTANACSLVAAFATGEYERIRGTLDDFLHQPYRQHLVPGLHDVIAAGVQAGALDGYLSGSGSTIACLTLENEDGIATAMHEALQKTGATGRVMAVAADNTGASVIA